MKLATSTYNHTHASLKTGGKQSMVQAKLQVNQPGDSYEQEADAMAEKVKQEKKKKNAGGGLIASIVQQKKTGKDGREEPTLMRKESGVVGVAVPAGMEGLLGRAQVQGSTLPEGTKSFMEQAFQQDFSGVRVHTGPDASQMNEQIQARAFTQGNHIFFNSGQYAPESPEGKSLLAHELTHVVQQGQAGDLQQIQRQVELRPPGRGEGSAFGRAQELIDRLNTMATGIRYRLDGRVLRYSKVAGASLSPFDLRMQGFIDQGAVLPMRLITKEDWVDGQPLWVDSFREAYVDLDDMLACSDLSFQLNMVHLLAERGHVGNYEHQIGMRQLDSRFQASHAAGFAAEASYLQDLIGDSSIQFLYEDARASGTDVFAFRSREGYLIFHVFPRDKGGIRAGSLYVLTRDRRRISVDDLIRERKTTVRPLIPKTNGNGQTNSAEAQANRMSGMILQQTGRSLTGTVMRKSVGAGPAAPGAGFAAGLQAAQGGGHPLPGGARRFMERSFGADFSGVRIHTDTAAGLLSDSIDAQAFTFGQDVFFSSGCFMPDSPEGAGLLAHELTHVLQSEGAGIIRRAPIDQTATVQGATPTAASNKKLEIVIDKKSYKIDTGEKRMEMPEISMPFFKYRNIDKVKTPIHAASTKQFDPLREITGKQSKSKNRRISTKQVENWRNQVSSPLSAIVRSKYEKSEHSKEGFYFFTTVNPKSNLRILGTLDDITDVALIPPWGRNGEAADFQVDHIEELQLGGADQTSNYELLDATANMSSGSLILNERKRQITASLKALEKYQKDKPKDQKLTLPKTEDVMANYLTQFITIADWNLGKNNSKAIPGGTVYWTLDNIIKGSHLGQLRPMSQGEINKLESSDKDITIYPRVSTSNNPLKVTRTGSLNPRNVPRGLNNLVLVQYNPDAKADENLVILEGQLFEKLTKKKLLKKTSVTMPVKKVPGLLSVGVMRNRLKDCITEKPEFVPLCEIEVLNADIDEATNSVVLGGNILPKISFLDKLGIDLSIEGDNLEASKTFTAGDLTGKLSSLLEITSGSLTVFAGTETGLGVEGNLDFIIKKLGSGFIKGRKASFEPFSLGFGFEFDKGLFDKSKIEGGYDTPEGKSEPEFHFSGHAEKTTEKSKIFKSATVDVNFADGIFTATGEVITRLDSIQKGTIQVTAGKGETSIVADFTLGEKIPGVKSGTLHFAFQQKPDGSYDINVLADIFTKFDAIPEVKLHGEYRSDGMFLFEGDANLVSPRFNGSIHFGITNQTVDKEGKLTGKPGKDITPFGNGNVDYKMTDWLHGKIGALVTPDGRTVLDGALIPDPHLQLLTIMKEPIDKKFGVFNTPRFTLFGIPHVAEIFVEVGGNFYFKASIGPLFLNNASLSFKELELAAPEKAIVEGQGDLDIPASAEFGVEAHITAGGEILVVKASVTLNGSIGLAVTANAGLRFAFSWSTATGLVGKEATAYLKAALELVGRLSGDLNVDLDLLLTTVNLYHKHLGDTEKRWPLGSPFEANFPLLFDREGGGFQMPSADQVKYEKPTIDKDTVKKAAVEEPPPYEPAPGKEEAMLKVRVLPANAEFGSNWITNRYERYNYIKNLKNKYPNLDWTFLDDEAKMLDETDFAKLSIRLLGTGNFPANRLGKKIRLMALSDFQDERMYVKPSSAADLRKSIEQLPETEEESGLTSLLG